MLTKEHLGAAVKKGEIDTVVVAFTDMQGRLMGKRVDGEYFMESSAHGEAVEGEEVLSPRGDEDASDLGPCERGGLGGPRGMGSWWWWTRPSPATARWPGAPR